MWRASARWPRRRSLPAARSWWSAGPWIAWSRSRARLAIFDGVPEFRGAEAYGYLPRDKVLALCTGSQGEPRAALARIAEDEHPEVALGKGDRVIFSSRAIPGNEKAVGRIINGLVGQGVEVITDRTHLVHVSGHPRRAELDDMYRLGAAEDRDSGPRRGAAPRRACQARPQRRGAARARCAATAIWSGSAPERTGDHRRGALGPPVQGRRAPRRCGGAHGRRRAGGSRFSGMVSVASAVDDNGELAADPEIELIGIPESDASGEPMAEIAHAAVEEAFAALPKPRRRDPESGGRGGAPRRPLGHRRALGQEADLPCSRAR